MGAPCISSEGGRGGLSGHLNVICEWTALLGRVWCMHGLKWLPGAEVTC